MHPALPSTMQTTQRQTVLSVLSQDGARTDIALTRDHAFADYFAMLGANEEFAAVEHARDTGVWAGIDCLPGPVDVAVAAVAL